MPSVRRWVLTHTELEIAVHALLLEFQLDGLSFRNSFFACVTFRLNVVRVLR